MTESGHLLPPSPGALWDEAANGFAEATSSPNRAARELPDDVGGFLVGDCFRRNRSTRFYRAIHPLMGSDWQLKATPIASGRVLEGLQIERAIAGAHYCPNVYRAFGGFSDPCFWVTSTRDLDAPTLEEVLAHAPGYRLSARGVQALARELGRALGAIHELGYLHLGLHPSHVALDDAGAVITDLQAAWKIIGPGSRPPHPADDARYAPPDRERTAPTVASDLYILGLLLYEAAWGALPSPRPASGLLLIRERRAFQCATRLPTPLVHAIFRCLHPRPERRFASADEFVRMASLSEENYRAEQSAYRIICALVVLGILCALLLVPILLGG